MEHIVRLATACLLAVGWLASWGCHPVQNRAGLGLSCPQQAASVFVDGRYVGTVRNLQDRYILLQPGPHRVELRLRGYYTRYRIIRLKPGEIGVLKVRLVPRMKWVPDTDKGGR